MYDRYPEGTARTGRAAHPGVREGMACVNGEAITRSLFRKCSVKSLEKYHPDGFADNSWSRAGIKTICYCENCRKLFLEECGCSLPEKS